LHLVVLNTTTTTTAPNNQSIGVKLSLSLSYTHTFCLCVCVFLSLSLSLSLSYKGQKKNLESSEMALNTIVLNKSTTAPSRKNSKYPKTKHTKSKINTEHYQTKKKNN
jgi:hypothetical protein